MIIFSEIGDKTFLIAALMAMKHPRFLVFSAAFSALIAMTILSAVLGHAVPTLIPKRFTNLLAAILFLAFGAKMLLEGYALHPGEGVSEEMKEVEMELEEREHQARRIGRRRSSISPYILESGRGARKARSNSVSVTSRSPLSSSSRSPSPSRSSAFTNALAGMNNLFFAAESGVGSDFYHDVSGRMGRSESDCYHSNGCRPGLLVGHWWCRERACPVYGSSGYW
jgi:putative Ca2+/H+ antiporter (TMEM165/GDT1 family)